MTKTAAKQTALDALIARKAEIDAALAPCRPSATTISTTPLRRSIGGMSEPLPITQSC
jgi:hypothetical protein